MKGKHLSIFAIVLGGLCAVFAVVSYQSAKAAAAMPFAAGGFDERYFWWPLFAACVWWSMAGLHFFASRKRFPFLVLLVASSTLSSLADQPAQLTYQEFDQSMGKGWRAFADQKKFVEAARAIEDYLARNPRLEPLNRENLHFHAAQCLAFDGSPASLATALVHLRDAHVVPEAADLPIRWNDYVAATEAFLKSDLPALKAARERIASGPKLNGKLANLDVVDRLIAHFGKSYAEAYGMKTVQEKKVSAGDNAPLLNTPMGRLKVGERVPLVWGMVLDGTIVSSESVSGKVVLLDVWSLKDKDRAKTQQQLSQLRSRFLGDKRFLIWSLCIDGEWEDWRKYCVAQKNLPVPNGHEVPFIADAHWWQAHLEMGSKEKAKFIAEYDVNQTPKCYLIGYGGKLAASFASVEKLEGSIKDQLRLMPDR